jgi:hypothetical protein
VRRLTQLGIRPGHRLRAGTVAFGVRTQDEILSRVLSLEVSGQQQGAVSRPGLSQGGDTCLESLVGRWPRELEILDDVQCQPVERVPAADYPRAGARSAPEFMPRLI